MSEVPLIVATRNHHTLALHSHECLRLATEQGILSPEDPLEVVYLPVGSLQWIQAEGNGYMLRGLAVPEDLVDQWRDGGGGDGHGPGDHHEDLHGGRVP